ncbi:divalent cation tolerance protein CutA [Acidianus infernus]|uniref:Divalent cation tolerance protein CutA n=1 Tax=Acidianus infernus TaxID=12915 RepID=A0A6A9QF34_ACIIN|nr:divalent-cation tolerance protein CutA [Acidianus infernus]MCY0874280.1 divalent-cation tolerance protein CutA [Acidianus infernus]MCY0883072.1 divalent-cation tolerance protein CutA [Acidianus infernus]MUM63876.1 divalent cation tolerance protein CutA [Acidianus infernus]
MTAIIVLTTISGLESGKKLARSLVEEKLAACVNIIPYVKSTYRWEGKVVEDDESLLIIKTDSSVKEKIIKRIKELHPYQLPEIITLDVTGGLENYLNWIAESVQQ